VQHPVVRDQDAEEKDSFTRITLHPIAIRRKQRGESLDCRSVFSEILQGFFVSPQWAQFWPKTNIYRGSKYPGPITLIAHGLMPWVLRGSPAKYDAPGGHQSHEEHLRGCCNG